MKATHLGRQRLLAYTLVAGIAAGGVAACSHNAAFGGSQLNFYSQDQEIAMGRQAAQQVNQTMGLYPDSNLQRYVNELGKKLAATSERPNLPWEFHIVNDPAVNAFALPGGFIYVTRGLLASVTNEAQLAGVIGHEIGHVTAQHQLHEMSKQQIASLGLAIGAAVSPTVNQFGGLISQGMQLLFLSYSRGDENQADQLGVRYMNRAGYDPHQMANVMAMLDQVTKQEGGSGTPEWLQTHPNPGNREQHVEQLAAQIKPDSMGHQVVADAYLERLNGLVYGDDPRDGYFQGSKFLDPGLRFQMEFPQGWQTQNSPQAVGAISPQHDAIVEATLAQGNSPESAAQQFATQQGVQAGPQTRVSLPGGNSGVAVPFSAQDPNAGQVQGTALFLDYNNQMFMLLGYGPSQAWSSRQMDVERTMQSFQPLTDPAALNAQPNRLQVVRNNGTTTLQQLAQQHGEAGNMDKLALINQVQPNQTLQPGQLVKLITGSNQALSSRNK